MPILLLLQSFLTRIMIRVGLGAGQGPGHLACTVYPVPSGPWPRHHPLVKAGSARHSNDRKASREVDKDDKERRAAIPIINSYTFSLVSDAVTTSQKNSKTTLSGLFEKRVTEQSNIRKSIFQILDSCNWCHLLHACPGSEPSDQLYLPHTGHAHHRFSILTERY